MQAYSPQIKSFLKRIVLVIGLYELCRVLFYFFNFSFFKEASFGEVMEAMFFGLRFDFFTIAFSNSLFILLSVIPAAFTYKKFYSHILKWTYILPNALFLLLNCVDFVYFPFTNKRSGFDIFNQVFGGQTDVANQLKDYVKDFWLVFIVFAAILFALFYGWKKTKPQPQASQFNYSFGNSLFYSAGVIISLALTFLGMRGGFQHVPLQIVDAGKYAGPNNTALVLNTPFSIIRSYDSERLEELNLADNKKAFEYVSPIHQYNSKPGTPKNVVVIILESFSKEFTGIGNRKSLTPFLDSLMKESLVFSNAWANGKQSIEGIPAILSSMPSLMNNPYINTKYSDNKINSFPQLLKQKGYTSAFFHGGKNGTMNFDSYANMAGFDYYFGKNEYNNDADFDGNWGIWDEPFLQFCSKKISEMKTPFFSSIFTLTSHHPFRVPKQYENKFPKTDLQISETIGYTDYALKKFFESAKKTSWFKNTLFVFVPDHTGMSEDSFYKNQIGQHAIPIIFYCGDQSMKGEHKGLMQQIDILPTVLDTLGYDKPFFSFGKSAFRKKSDEHALFYEQGNYWVVQDSACYIFNNYKISRGFQFRNDSTLAKNICNTKSPSTSAAENYFRSFIQLYHHSLNHNLTHADR